MIDLHYWPTPNGQKITIFLEESGLPYKIHPVNISEGDQLKPQFLAISPNGRMPAIVDTQPLDDQNPLPIFESGAILWYLAEKAQKFIPSSVRGKAMVSEWLFWQTSGLGPMAGQNHHFNHYAPEIIPYAIDRYVKETKRLYGVLNKQLDGKDFVAWEYSIADMAIYPWIESHEKQSIDLADYPHVEKWFNVISKRPAVKKAYEIALTFNASGPMTDKAKKILFGQAAH